MPAAKSLFIVIIGCGRLGAYLANRLSRQGHHVVVVDAHPEAFDALSPEYSGFRVEGDASEFAVLSQANIDQADMVIVATNNENINVMVGQVARKLLNVPRVIVRIDEPDRRETYEQLGLDTVCPASLVGDEILQSMVQHTMTTLRSGLGQ